MKKLVRYIGSLLLLTVLLLAISISYLYIVFNNFELKDDYPVDDRNLVYFTHDYMSSRANFRKNAAALKKRFTATQLSEIAVKDKENSDLAISVCYIPAKDRLLSLLILSSGTHGIEGHVGSATQSLFMNEFVSDDLIENCGILLLHAVNPYGYHRNRRVTENNVDLNRNCSLDGTLYESTNPGYSMVQHFINPKDRLDMSSMGMRFFFLRAANIIRRYSMPVIRQAVLGGQYEHPEGIFFGGNQLEPQLLDLISLIEGTIPPYGKIVALDMHTGYGERGTLHLLSNPLDKEVQSMTEQFFGEYSVEYGDHDDFYSPTGEFVGMISKLSGSKPCIPMVLEYGTFDSQTTLGSLKSLQIMVAENQAFHHGCEGMTDQEEIEDMFHEMFYPESPSWRSNAMENARMVFEEITPRL